MAMSKAGIHDARSLIYPALKDLPRLSTSAAVLPSSVSLALAFGGFEMQSLTLNISPLPPLYLCIRHHHKLPHPHRITLMAK